MYLKKKKKWNANRLVARLYLCLENMGGTKLDFKGENLVKNEDGSHGKYILNNCKRPIIVTECSSFNDKLVTFLIFIKI